MYHDEVFITIITDEIQNRERKQMFLEETKQQIMLKRQLIHIRKTLGTQKQ
jgi:hypothetical protein